MAIVPPVIVVMEKACRNAAKSLIRDFGELEKLQISKKDKNDFVSSADIEHLKLSVILWEKIDLIFFKLTRRLLVLKI